jgi:hypothetical protein
MTSRTAVLLAVFALASSALGQTFSVTTTHNLTGSPPTLSTDGASIDAADGFNVTVSANSGQTITGGSLLCYFYGAVSSSGSGSPPTRRWMRCPAVLDFTPGTSVRDAPSGDYQTPVGWGRIAYIPSAVTVSGGSTVTVTIAVRKGADK